MRLLIDAIADATQGTVYGAPVTVAGASIDSRSVQPGQLFVPLVAERDGHDFIAIAVAGGATAYLTDREPDPTVEATAVRVADTTAAFTALAPLARTHLPDAVIGITGSVGKTSVKDLLAGVLATTFVTAASEKSFNNELGVPLTLLNAPDNTEVVVQEMGARGLGHIAELCALARPTAAIVTMVAEVHTSEFGTIEDVARGKSELVAAIATDGFVVLNHADARVRAMAALTDATVWTYGVGGDVYADGLAVDDDLRPRFQLVSPWGSVAVSLAVHGVHQVDNALAAATAALAQGVPLDRVAAGLATSVLSPWRMELRRSASGATIINDAYNANPTAMAAALASLAAIDADRRIAVLGVMAELGDVSKARHAEMGALAAELGIEVIAVAAPAYRVGTHVADVEAALAHLAELDARTAVLVKASRSADLQRVALGLVPDGDAGPRTSPTAGQ